MLFFVCQNHNNNNRFSAPERRCALVQFGQAEAGRGQRLQFRQEAEVQRPAERDKLPIQGHRSEEGGWFHTRPAVQPNIRQQCADPRGKSLSVTLLHDQQSIILNPVNDNTRLPEHLCCVAPGVRFDPNFYVPSLIEPTHQSKIVFSHYSPVH